MGTFRTTIMIESAERRGETRTVEDALVDTGSEYTWVPRDVLVELGVRPEKLQRFVVADGRHNVRVDAQRKQLVPAGPILAGAAA